MAQTESVADGRRKIGHMKREEREVGEERRGEEWKKKENGRTKGEGH